MTHQVLAPPYASHFDANQVPSILGVEGTLGTADTAGTAHPLPIGVNPATGALYVQDLGTSSGTVNVIGGTIAQVTTVSNLTNGSVVVTVGTFTTGTIQNLVSGTINALASGTITAGTVNSVTTVSNLTNGSVNILTGTVTRTSNIGTIESGTVTTRGTGFEGGTVSVGTAAVELTFTGITRTISVTADSNNGTMLYVGPSSVTQAGANAIVRLDAGYGWSIDLNDASAPLYVVAGTTGQKAYKAALL